ncbi:MAG: hypothetical protein H7839_14710 [Magnetococcus sp. YQC-5]
MATLFHPLLGLQAMPNNWRKNLFIINTKHPPELVPGLKLLTDDLSFYYFVNKINKGDTFLDRFVTFIISTIFFLPAMLYRWSLKSTCWLYFPLIYIISTPKWFTTDDQFEPALLVKLLNSSREENIKRFMVVPAIIISAYSTHLINQLACIKADFLITNKFIYLWNFNWNALTPWLGCSLINALITYKIYTFSDKANKAWTLLKETNPLATPLKQHVNILLWMSQSRSLFSALGLFSALIYAILALNEIDLLFLPDWLSFLNLIYGKYLP